MDLLGTNRSIRAAEKVRKLRKTGITVREANDLIIAYHWIDEKIPLLFYDRDIMTHANRTTRKE